MEHNTSVIRTQGLEINKLMRNVYSLLAVITGMASLSAYLAAGMGIPMIPWWGMLLGFYGLLFMVHMNKDSVAGLFFVSLLAVFMGATLSPVLHSIADAGMGNLIAQAFGGMAATFIGLSLFAISSRKDFSFMSSFLFSGLLVAFLCGIGAVVFNMPTLSLVVSAAFILLSSGLILFETSSMVHEPNQNYITVTVTLFVSMYNLFVSMLHLLTAFSGDD